jgi:DNA-directed RNA polymerase specialized sigma24 family protein
MQEQMLAKRVTAKKANLTRRTIDPVVRLTTAFAELDEEHRIVLCLHYLERLSLEQIAVVLDDTVESVKEVYDEAVVRLASKGSRKRRRRKAA